MFSFKELLTQEHLQIHSGARIGDSLISSFCKSSTQLTDQHIRPLLAPRSRERGQPLFRPELLLDAPRAQAVLHGYASIALSALKMIAPARHNAAAPHLAPPAGRKVL